MLTNPTRLAASAALVAMAACSAQAADPTFQLIATERSAQVPHWIKPDVPIPLSDDGKVAFVIEDNDTFVDGVYTYDGALSTVSLTGYDNVRSLAIRSAGDVLLVADRDAGATDYRGVYKTSTSAAPVTTYHEDAMTFDPDPEVRFVAMSENGTVAFSSIVSSSGALYRGNVSGAPAVLRSGSGPFYNTQMSDVNDAGTVATQFEYSSPVGGEDGGALARAILVFDSTNPSVTQTRSVVEQMSVSKQPMPSINSAGQVAFALNSPITMEFFDPANDSTGTLIDKIVLEPGVYVSDPVGLGTLPRTYTQIADLDGAFDSFGRVLINDAGTVVFEATANGEFGFFHGGDPVADLLLATGPSALYAGEFITVLELGELNNNDQFSFLTSHFGGDRQVWIATIPEPGALALLGVPLALLTRQARRRRVSF